MSLPYPSMTFVPLDVLTADEMNQLVANIESLADGSGLDAGAIGTSAIANSAITSELIDWTSLNFLGDFKTGEVELPFKGLNNEPLFKAIVDIGALPNNAWKNVQVSNEIGRCYWVKGVAWNPSSSQCLPLPYCTTSTTASIGINYIANDATHKFISIGTGMDRSGFTSCYAEIIYAKVG